MEKVTQSIGVPSLKGMGNAFTDAGIGAVGGLAYGLSKSILGSGFLGTLIATIVSGSLIKGNRGTAIATISGFMLLADMLTGTASQASAEPSRGTM